MPFPPHIDRVFDAYAVAADTKAALYDLYLSMGDEVLEVFGDIADGAGSPAALRPEHCAGMRARVVERYLARNHPQWLEGKPTPSLYHPRAGEGRASGIAIPLGAIDPRAAALAGEGQPLPDGIVVQGRNAHFGGRSETISFDLVAANLADAIRLGVAAGQQHTLPGSAGETSGSVDAERRVALVWEIQPNVYKPAGERNRDIAKLYRRHRNWHLVTLASAIGWLREKSFRTYVVRGEALPATHEVNAAKPVAPAIIALHDRTVRAVAAGLDLALHAAARDDEQLLLNSEVMNVGLRKRVQASGAAGAVWRVST
jgi:hypothetical protein